MISLSDGYFVPWNYCCDVFFPQRVYLGQTQQWCCPLLDDAVSSVSLAVRVFPFGVPRLLLRLSKSPIRTAGQNKPNPETSTRTSLVHESHSLVRSKLDYFIYN